jgi:hypothetical protein
MHTDPNEATNEETTQSADGSETPTETLPVGEPEAQAASGDTQ